MQYLTLFDLILTPFYLGILFLIAKKIRDKFYPSGHVLRSYFLPGLWMKFGGVIFIALIYQYYYNGGDTYNYFRYAKLVNSTFSDSIDIWLKLILRMSPEQDPRIYDYSLQIEFYADPASYMVVRLAAIIGLISFNTYIPIALIFAFISYTGIWAMYQTFVRFYPRLHKQLALAFLFIPSVFVWGSSIFKDTICMFGLGWITYTTFRVFVNRDFRLTNLLLMAVSFYLIAVVKVYILLAFLPSLSLWLLLNYSDRIRSASLRLFTRLAAVSIIAAAFVFFSTRFAEELNKYSIDKLAQTLETTRSWIVYSSGDEGSAYDLGTLDPTLTGIISKFPSGVAVTLFRPFLWEVKKPIQLLSSLEGLLFIILLLLVIYRMGLLNLFRKIFKDPNLAFFFIFSMIFAFAVGVSTGNFGTLSRYKIPCMPFFGALLVILLSQAKEVAKTKSTHAHAKPVYPVA